MDDVRRGGEPLAGGDGVTHDEGLHDLVEHGVGEPRHASFRKSIDKLSTRA